jgi:hypothetical protein
MARFADMILNLGYGGSLVSFEPSISWITQYVASEDTQSQNRESESADQNQPKPIDIKKEPQDLSERAQNLAGSFAVWKYYAKTVGKGDAIVLLLFTVTATVSTNFPRKYSCIKWNRYRRLIRKSGLWLKEGTADSSPSIGWFIGVYIITAIFDCLSRLL